LPHDGRIVYVRLWWCLWETWQYRDYIYQTSVLALARLTEPAPGSTLAASGVTFRWTAGSNVSQIALYVGTTAPGSYDIYYASQGMGLSAPVSGLPINGKTVYVRLWSNVGGGWYYDDYVYQAATGGAVLRTPIPGSTLNSSTVSFGWTGGGEASRMALYVGTGGAGSYDIYAGCWPGCERAIAGTDLATTVPGLPSDGRKMYVRLWSYVRGEWQYDDQVYQASTATSGGAELTTPPPGTTLHSSSVTFGWASGSGVSETALYVGSTGPGSFNIYAAMQGGSHAATVSGLPGDGSPVYARLWCNRGGTWQYDDYIYRSTTGGAQLTTPEPRSTLTSSDVTFGWTVGERVLKVVLYVGIGGVGSYDIYAATQDGRESATVSGLPTDGATVFVRLWSYSVEGWQYGDYTYTAMK
jgi:hypothetical protein